jgi:hypothetical protein
MAYGVRPYTAKFILEVVNKFLDAFVLILLFGLFCEPQCMVSLTNWSLRYIHLYIMYYIITLFQLHVIPTKGPMSQHNNHEQ